jgi:rhodanese-related sulfurtransferase
MSAAFAMLASVSGCGYDGPIMSVEELAAALDDPHRRPTVIDVRPRSQFAKGHIRGARNYPLAGLKGKVADISSIKGDVAVICNCGKNALAAAKQLRESGITVTLVEGGYKKWSAAGYPLAKN